MKASAAGLSAGSLERLGSVAALAASALLVWLITRQPFAVAGFAGGLLALGGLARLLSPRSAMAEPQYALPDWSVTVAAIDRSDCALAIIDRAGRLVCANPLYEQWFGIAHAPPRLPLDNASLERLAKAGRSAWRDGAGEAELLEGPTGQWKASVRRAGRGDDYLVWTLTALNSPDPVGALVPHLDGRVGRALAQAGISAAIVNPDGKLRAASAGFAQRAAGAPDADLAGQDFTSLLRQDENDRITWARDGTKGASLTLFYMPVADPDAPGPINYDEAPSLILVADHGIGIGGGASEGKAAIPHLEALLFPLRLGLAMVDRDGHMLFANPAFLRAAGIEDGVTPAYPTDFVVQEDKGPLSDAVRRHAQGPVASGDIAVRIKGQSDEPVSLSLAAVRGLGEAAVLLVLTDTTEETRLKRQVAQATKMQAVGQLAGGVAHDFNNVLTAILGICDLMLLRHTPGDSDYDDIQQIRANANRSASLTRQLLAFSRQQTLRPQVLQLPDVVSDASHLLKRLIGEKIELVVRHDRDLGPVRADPSQLEQVIVNLAVNARDAITEHGDGAGKITLATRKITAADVRAMPGGIMPQVDYTALVVGDTGIGIPSDNLAKIFEPFFTTKEQGKGTGLGLSTVYGIVKQSGGFIFADSMPGEGTTFTVYLPVHHGEAAAPLRRVGADETAREWAGGGRILLVEDEDIVRAVAGRALTRAGYAVTAASDGEEGLEIVNGGAEFDLIVSDVVMPAMDGPSMVRAIREIAPDMPVLFMSGYAEEQLRSELDLANVHFLAKPFTVQEIGEKVGEVLTRVVRG